MELSLSTARKTKLAWSQKQSLAASAQNEDCDGEESCQESSSTASNKGTDFCLRLPQTSWTSTTGKKAYTADASPLNDESHGNKLLGAWRLLGTSTLLQGSSGAPIKNFSRLLLLSCLCFLVKANDLPSFQEWVNHGTSIKCPVWATASRPYTVPRQAAPKIVLAGLTAHVKTLQQHEESWDQLMELNCRHGVDLWILSRGLYATQNASENFQQTKEACFPPSSLSTCASATFLVDPPETKSIQNRVDRIAHLRDYQRQHLITHYTGGNNHVDDLVFVFVDLDLTSLPSNAAILKEARRISVDNTVDAICAAGVMHHPFGYYDIFATVLEDGTFVYPLSGRLDGSEAQPHENPSFIRDDVLYANVTQEGLLQHFVTRQQNSENDDPVPVQSCFGGLTLYRASAWLTSECGYASSLADDHPKYLANVFDRRPCEHVTFHSCLRRHAVANGSDSNSRFRIAVQPQLHTVWDQPSTSTSFFLAGGSINHGLWGFLDGLVQSKYQATVRPDLRTRSKLVNGHYQLAMDTETGALVIQNTQDKTRPPVEIWRSSILSFGAEYKWQYAFLTLEVTGTLTLSHQQSQSCPIHQCFQAVGNATECCPCRRSVWSFKSNSNKAHLVHLGRDGILRIVSGDGTFMESITQNVESDQRKLYASGHDILAELRHYAGENECINSGTEQDINRFLSQAGSFATAILCPRAVFKLEEKSIVFTAPFQRIFTMGHPTDKNEQAVIRIVGPNVITAVNMAHQEHALLSHVTIDGNRPVLGPAPKDRYGQALILGGSKTAGPTIRHIHAHDTRSWSTLHLMEGPVDARCHSALVEHNHLGPSGVHQEGHWADGLSMACASSVIRNNTIIDATDVGLVVFGAPGSVVEDNMIVTRTRTANGGITMVDHDPFNGDFRGTYVRRNIVENLASAATVIAGISMGPRTWFSDLRVLNGATVTHNTVRGRRGSILFPYAVDGVVNWTVAHNSAEIRSDDKDADVVFYVPTFSLNQSTSSGNFQEEFKMHPILPESAIKNLHESLSSCLSSGTDVDINRIFASAAPFAHAVLCPGSVFNLTQPIKFTAPNQEIYTRGKPVSNDGYRRRALLRLVNISVSTAVDMMHRDYAVLSHVKVEGNRPGLGQALIQNYGQSLIRAGGNSIGQQIRYVEATETRSWTTIHLMEGDHVNNRCVGALVERCVLGLAGSHVPGSWASGLALACASSIIRNNTVTDTTDAGIIVFGAPGSVIENNRVLAHSQSMNAGISLVDYDPFGGDFTGTVVKANTICAPGESGYIGTGIAMGVGTNRHESEWDKFLLRGAAVTGNILKGNIAVGLDLDGVTNWTVLGNIVGTAGSRFQRNKFHMNRSTCSGTFQPEFDQIQRTTAMAGKPAIAWLASFPNSGTSYTLKTVTEVANVSCATNYGAETDSVMDLLHPDKGALGSPFWLPPSHIKRPTSGFVLTKTHCGGRCVMCAPRGYLISKQEFLDTCLETHISGRNSDGEFRNKIQAGKSDFDRVERIVHLVRDPFDNVVSRFHHARKSHLTDQEKGLYPKSADGFRKFCADKADRHSRKDEPPVPQEIWDVLLQVPCHHDIVRYVNWHNHVFGLAKLNRIPSLVLHYERYGTHWNHTVMALLDFLGRPVKFEDGKSAAAKFEKGKTYRHYYEKSEVEAVRQALQFLSSADTWDHIQRYFEPEASGEKTFVPNRDPLAISLLISYPNSGTSYTLQNARRESNISAATNYEREANGKMVPIHSENPSGPFWLPGDFERPTHGNILTKTHCGGYDFLCQSSACFRISQNDFLARCLETHVHGASPERQSYGIDKVSSFVHLVRDPYDNIVSRFHHERKSRNNDFSDDEKALYKKSSAGFRAFCANKVDLSRPPVTEEVWQVLLRVPCHNDFLKYIFWHNRAFEVTIQSGLPSHVIHYDTYGTHWNQTTSALLDFLGQPRNRVEPSHPFKEGKAYRNYYEPNEVRAVQHMFELLANAETWEYVKRYFDFEHISDNSTKYMQEVAATGSSSEDCLSVGDSNVLYLSSGNIINQVDMANQYSHTQK